MQARPVLPGTKMTEAYETRECDSDFVLAFGGYVVTFSESTYAPCILSSSVALSLRSVCCEREQLYWSIARNI